MPCLAPAAFHLVALDREVAAFERAVRAAPRGVDDGTVYWTDRADRLDLAVVLEPEAPAARTLEAVYVLTVAAGDALGTLLPPQVPVAFAWPGDLILDGAKVGQVQAALAPVAGAGASALAGAGPDRERRPARRRSRPVPGPHLAARAKAPGTSPGAAPGERHAPPAALDRALAGGRAGPVRAAWNPRCFRLGEAELALADRRVAGEVKGLDAGGAFVVGDHRLELSENIIGPRKRLRARTASVTASPDFWRSSGWRLLDRRDDGRHLATDGFLAPTCCAPSCGRWTSPAPPSGRCTRRWSRARGSRSRRWASCG